MENGEKFVDACFEAGVDLVMFGHQHERHVEFRKPLSEITEAFSGRGHGIHFLCCPSTLEFSETDNGFWFLDFQTDHFLLRSYSWNGSSFVTEAPSRFVYDRIIGIRSASGRG